MSSIAKILSSISAPQTRKLVQAMPTELSLFIWSSIKAFKGETTITINLPSDVSFKLKFVLSKSNGAFGKSMISRNQLEGQLNNLDRSQQSPVALLSVWGFLALLPEELLQEHYRSPCFFHKTTTESTNMRSNRKVRISGLAATEHARNRTLPDLTFPVIEWDLGTRLSPLHFTKYAGAALVRTITS